MKKTIFGKINQILFVDDVDNSALVLGALKIVIFT